MNNLEKLKKGTNRYGIGHQSGGGSEGFKTP